MRANEIYFIDVIGLSEKLAEKMELEIMVAKIVSQNIDVDRVSMKIIIVVSINCHSFF